MSDKSPVEKHLLQAQDQGLFDSEGSFTIAGEEAVGKLAAFQLPRKSAWVLKVVQSAVTSQSTKIRVKQSASQTSFHFDPTEPFDVDVLKANLLSPEVTGSRSCCHLAAGLRAVGIGDKRPFSLQVDGSGERTVIEWRNNRLTHKKTKVSTSAETRVTLIVDFPPQDAGRAIGGLVRGARRATDEYLELVKNCDICPIQLIVDGRRVDTLHSPPDNSLNSSLYLSLNWVHRAQANVGPPLALPKGLKKAARSWKLTDRFSDHRVFHFMGDLSQDTALFFSKLFFSYKLNFTGKNDEKCQVRSVSRPSTICWVIDGVVSEREPAKWESSPISFELYLSAGDLGTDVSGLKVLEDTAKEERVQFGMDQIYPQTLSLQEAIVKHASLNEKKLYVHGAAGMAAFALCPFTVGKSYAAGASAFVAFTKGAIRQTTLKECESSLQRFQERLTKREVNLEPLYPPKP